MSETFDKSLDTSGLDCPLPILRLKQVLKSMTSGQTVKMLATDSGAQSDVPAFCAQTGHRLLDTQTDVGSFIFVIQKA